MKFLLKQLVGAFATPLAAALLMVVGAGLLRAFGRRRAATALLVLAALLVYAGALMPVSDALLSPLERQYPPLGDDAKPPSVSAIVVLGSAYLPRDGIPVSAAIADDGLARIVEGVRLAHLLPEARLVVSGGVTPGGAPSARGYARLARELGIPDATLVVLDQSLDTGDEARDVSGLLGQSPFLLVTSAYHMPRAMRLMQRVGLHPIPAATGHRGDAPSAGWWRVLVPTSEALRKTDRALHEYMGLLALAAGQD